MGVGRVIWKGTAPDAEMFELLFGEAFDGDVEIDLAEPDKDLEILAVEVMLANKGRYTDEQWRRACIIQNGSSDNPDSITYDLPVRKPDGVLDERAMRGAVKKLVNGSWPQETKREAARRLVRLFQEIDENAPDTLLGLAGRTKQPENYYYSDHTDEAAFVITPLNDESPVELNESASDGKVRFWKQLLPYRKFTYNKDGVKATVNVTKSFAKKIVSNFGKAPEMCQLIMATEGPHHSDGPGNTAGEIEKIEARKDGIYGLCAVMEDKAQILKAFPKMGVSVGLNTNYVRRNDGKKFGPIIFHGAVTPRPYLHGMKPWQLVLSDAIDPEEVINLSEGEYEAIEATLEQGDEPNNEGGKVEVKVVDGRIVVLDDDGNAVEGATLSDEDLAKIRQSEDGGELEGRVTTLSEDLAQERRERREERNQFKMSTDYRTVPPAFRKVLLPLINLADSDPSQEITLSEGEGANRTERKLPASKALWELADYMKSNHAIELGERGNQEDQPEEKPEDVQVAELAEERAKETGITYEQALVDVQIERENSAA